MLCKAIVVDCCSVTITYVGMQNGMHTQTHKIDSLLPMKYMPNLVD